MRIISVTSHPVITEGPVKLSTALPIVNVYRDLLANTVI